MKKINGTIRKTLASLLIVISVLLFGIIFGAMLRRGIGEIPKILSIGAIIWFVHFIWRTFVPKASGEKGQSESVGKKLPTINRDDEECGGSKEVNASEAGKGEKKREDGSVVVDDTAHWGESGAKLMRQRKPKKQFVFVIGLLVVVILLLLAYYWMQISSEADNVTYQMPMQTEASKEGKSVERYITIKNIDGRYPEFSSGALSEQYLERFTEAEGQAIKNEVYARHGMMFYDSSLQRYYESQEWYYPVYRDVSKKVSDIERYNLRKYSFKEDWGRVEPQYLEYVIDEEMGWEMGFPKGWTLMENEYGEPTLRKVARVNKDGRMAAEILVFANPDVPIITVEKEVIYSQLRNEGVTPTEYGQRYLSGMKYYYVKGYWQNSDVTCYGIYFYIVSQRSGYIIECVSVSPGWYNDVFYECFYSFRELCR